jgi:alpha-tubulin suppressor-like RCC1 family protein
MGVELPEIDLGTGSHVAKLALGGLYSCAVLDQASVKCWGYNLGGELGQGDRERRGDQPGETGDNLPPIELGTERRVERLAAGQFQNCAVLDDGSVKCWGSHVSGIDETNGRGWAPGQMGDDLPVVNLGSRGVVDVTAGQAYACALVDDGSAKCWGTNNLGQLGVGDTLFRSGYQLGDGLPAVAFGTGRRATRVVAAYEHACALLEGGSVKCWGGNSNGQLGLGDTDNRGDGPGEMGDDLPPVELGDGRSATDIVGGYGHTCVLLDDGSVKCWGFNETGELGLGDTENRGDEPGEMGNELPPVNLGTGRRVTKLDAGLRHTCALLDDGSLKCWGFNGDGRLGLGDTEDRGDEPDEMGDNLPAVELGF